MHGRDYIRTVFNAVRQEESAAGSKGAFLMAALDIMAEIESPLKEEALVRLVVLELDLDERARPRLTACA